ncbi:MAG: 50S ribosomal protein L23 [Patescibacteria group bacterium]|jgi:large subunit ribosomal protein L23
MRTDLVLKRPIITEKSMVAAQAGKYTFEVDRTANKHAIAEAVENQFKVNVINVSTTKIKGKTRRFGARRQPVQMTDSKKAIVELKKGQKIELFEIKEEK